MIAERVFAWVFSTIAVAAQTSPLPSAQVTPATGSISGVVRDAATGSPLAQVPIMAGPSLTTSTDAEGRYTLRNVPAGWQSLIAGSPIRGNSQTKSVTLSAGQDLASIDFRLQATGVVSGKVLDANDEPMPGLEVVLVAREYSLGALRYFRRRQT